MLSTEETPGFDFAILDGKVRFRQLLSVYGAYHKCVFPPSQGHRGSSKFEISIQTGSKHVKCNMQFTVCVRTIAIHLYRVVRKYLCSVKSEFNAVKYKG